jgi:hypothetical protein
MPRFKSNWVKKFSELKAVLFARRQDVRQLLASNGLSSWLNAKFSLKDARQKKKALCLAILFLIVIGSPYLTPPPPLARAQGSRLHSSKPDEQQVKRLRMLSISKQLGVTCVHCHNLKDFRDGSKAAYKVGLEHIRITDWLNSKAGLNKKPTIDCIHCHRGDIRPKIEISNEKYE